MANIRLIAVSLAAFGLASCASSNLYTGADGGGHRFSQVGRPKPLNKAVPAQTAAATAATPFVSPAAPATAESAPVMAPAAPTRLASAAPAPISRPARRAPVSLDEARRRVIALLSAEGFAPEPDVGGELISASRMVTVNEGSREAVCGVHALSHPCMYAANVDVRLTPGALGVEVGVDARFEEMDQNLISGELSKHACVSRGVLEAQVRRAATGG
jgi:hypothetical protein